MNPIAQRLAASATLALLGLSATALAARAQGIDPAYPAAKAEGAFVLYVGGPTAPWEAAARIFEQRWASRCRSPAASATC